MAVFLPRAFLSSTYNRFTSHFRQFHHFPITSISISPIPRHFPNQSLLLQLHFRTFSSSSNSSTTTTTTTTTITNSNASFDWSDDEEQPNSATAKKTKPTNLPPPYDPFSKTPAVEEPDDPSNLQEVFHKMRTEGLTAYAVKMFDALSKDGRTHEALDLFALIKDRGAMPDVVAYTSVIEAYANAGGHSKEALRSFDRMLVSGVLPNAYTYAVLVKGLAKDGKTAEARKFLLEMLGKGMRPNAGTYVAVLEAYVKDGKTEDARGLVEEMEGKGFVPEEKAVREQLAKRGQMFRIIMGLLFRK